MTIDEPAIDKPVDGRYNSPIVMGKVDEISQG
jgi:hypothetical protein